MASDGVVTRSPGRLLIAHNLTDAVGSRVLADTITVLAVLGGMAATELGVLNAVESTVVVVIAVPTSLLLDRVGFRWVLPVAMSAKLALGLAAGLVFAVVGFDGIATILFVAAVACFGVVSELGQLIAARELSRAGSTMTRLIAFMEATDKVASLAVPALVGFFLARGLGLPLLVAAMSSLVCAVGTALVLSTSSPSRSTDRAVIPAQTQEHAQARTSARLSEVFLGFRIIWLNRRLRCVVILLAATNAGLGMGDTVLVVLVLQVLQLSPVVYGALSSVGAATALCAALVAPAVLNRWSSSQIFMSTSVAQLAFAVLPLVASLAPGWAVPLLIAHDVGWSATITILGIAAATLAAREVHLAAVARVTAASRVVTIGVIPVAAVGGGLLTDTWGTAPALLAWVLVAATAMILCMSIQRAWQSDDGQWSREEMTR
ncbi:MFS transporter [Microbacterium sp. M1A1_1b]|uniref:MFS transporter n=1 Tax=Curtobacterium sp. VKM Ac-2922 TaxID=2929475 RepID=UPI001FB48309|nr:MFS transporter [Curtobacterium sp. VKM Ac-2922]MCJ1715727.1 hypothetical protein [Curtobacterium sp. VKM Ac-2922]